MNAQQRPRPPVERPRRGASRAGERGPGILAKHRWLVPLLFVAANNSVEAGDTLVAITSDVGTVAVTGNGAIPAGGALVVGPAGEGAEAMGSARPVVAEVTLTEPVTNGLTYNFTFDFAKAGKVTVAVPISAGEPAPE